MKLERNTVRMIENFSTGARGSKSAEVFLQNDCKLIFLHRKGSLFPFCSSYTPEMYYQIPKFQDILAAQQQRRSR